VIEGNSSADVAAAGAALSRELQPLLGADRAQILTSVYQLEFSRCKTPWSAG
jgi:urea transporter